MSADNNTRYKTAVNKLRKLWTIFLFCRIATAWHDWWLSLPFLSSLLLPMEANLSAKYFLTFFLRFFFFNHRCLSLALLFQNNMILHWSWNCKVEHLTAIVTPLQREWENQEIKDAIVHIISKTNLCQSHSQQTNTSPNVPAGQIALDTDPHLYWKGACLTTSVTPPQSGLLFAFNILIKSV